MASWPCPMSCAGRDAVASPGARLLTTVPRWVLKSSPMGVFACLDAAICKQENMQQHHQESEMRRHSRGAACLFASSDILPTTIIASNGACKHSSRFHSTQTCRTRLCVNEPPSQVAPPKETLIRSIFCTQVSRLGLSNIPIQQYCAPLTITVVSKQLAV